MNTAKLAFILLVISLTCTLARGGTRTIFLIIYICFEYLKQLEALAFQVWLRQLRHTQDRTYKRQTRSNMPFSFMRTCVASIIKICRESHLFTRFLFHKAILESILYKYKIKKQPQIDLLL